MSHTENEPLYKQPWFVFILAPLLVSCVFTLIFVYRSIEGADDVVVGNYYKDGLGINQSLREKQVAQDLGLRAALEFTQISDELFAVDVNLMSAEGNISPEILVLQLNHPVKEDMDRRVVLRKQEDGLYVGENELYLKYRWYLRIEPVDADVPWILTGEINFSDNKNLVLGANDR